MTVPVTTRPSRIPMPLVLRVNAAIDVVLGFVLLAATWEDLWEELDTIPPAPWIWAQIAGLALVGIAALTWRASSLNDETSQLLTRMLAVVNIVAFVQIAIWLFSDDVGVPDSGTLGSWVIDVVAVVTLVLGILEARAFRRR
jgi:hypothetical protein